MPGHEISDRGCLVLLEEVLEDCQGLHPVRHRGGQLESDRTADVVDDEMKALQLERVDGGHRALAEPRPGVVEVLRAVGEPQAGQGERYAALRRRREAPRTRRLNPLPGTWV